MPPNESIVKGCVFLSEVSCYKFWQDFATPITTVLVAAITIFIAFKQLSKQHANNLKAQNEQYKCQTRIELFREVGAISESSSSIIRDVSTYCMVKKYSSIDLKAEINQIEYQDIAQKFGNALLVLISKVETHEIVNLKLFRAFRFSLQSIQHDLMALRASNNTVSILENLLQLTSDAQMYIGDFQICMQNMAYGEMFGSAVPYRVPADKRIKVITNNVKDLDELIDFFCKETNWGKTCAMYEAEAEARFSS